MRMIEKAFRIVGIILCITVVTMNIGITVLFCCLPAPLSLKVVVAVLLAVISIVVATEVPRLCKALKKK